MCFSPGIWRSDFPGNTQIQEQTLAFIPKILEY
ncbi:flagellar biosynthetic protein FliQ [Sinobaca sp. H24]